MLRQAHAAPPSATDSGLTCSPLQVDSMHDPLDVAAAAAQSACAPWVGPHVHLHWVALFGCRGQWSVVLQASMYGARTCHAPPPHLPITPPAHSARMHCRHAPPAALPPCAHSDQGACQARKP